MLVAGTTFYPKARVFRPVHAKLKFMHDSGHDAHRKVDDEQFAPELRHHLVLFIARADVLRLH